uniref:Uncharacterized protein n=1 Tax=Mycena chlorophos TaxID=658473 RepID=A0ABQ0KVS2_MYCCL|nr:predicted protein [Mycena chlorophos]
MKADPRHSTPSRSSSEEAEVLPFAFTRTSLVDIWANEARLIGQRPFAGREWQDQLNENRRRTVRPSSGCMVGSTTQKRDAREQQAFVDDDGA